MLSTCNRVEVYAAVTAFHGGLADIGARPRRAAPALTPASWPPHLYVHYGVDAVRHTFRVAAGLDSMVVGEAQILGQLRDAYQLATEADTAGRVLHELLQQALRVGKRAHAETGIDRRRAAAWSAPRSPTATAPGPRRPPALVVGAGAMGALAAGRAGRAGAARCTSPTAAPSAPNGSPSCTAPSRSPFADAARLLADGRRRRHRHRVARAGARPSTCWRRCPPAARRCWSSTWPCPRDVAPGVGGPARRRRSSTSSSSPRRWPRPPTAELPRPSASSPPRSRRSSTWLRGADMAPTVAALRARADEVVAAELRRLAQRRPELTDEQRAEVAHTVHRIVQRLLHQPTVRVRSSPPSPAARQYAAAAARAVRPGTMPGDRCRHRPGGRARRRRCDRMTSETRHPGQRAGAGPVRHRRRGRPRGHRRDRWSWSRSSPPATAPARRCSSLGVGVFVSALRDALLAKEIDFAVHSYKDLPTAPADGLVIAAVPPRDDPRDALVARDGLTLAELPAGARVGTGALRRIAQLNALGRGWSAVPIRGNVDTRLRKRRRRRARRGRAGPRRAGPARPRRRDHRDPRPDADAARARAGRAGGRVPGRRCRAASSCSPRSTTSTPERRSPPSGRCWPRWRRLHRTGRRAGRSRRRPTTAAGDLSARCGVQRGRRVAVRLSRTGTLADAAEVGRASARRRPTLDDGRRTERLYWECSMTRTRKAAGHIAFVGAGPGDPGLLTRRAYDALVSTPTTSSTTAAYPRRCSARSLRRRRPPRRRVLARPRARPATWPRCCSPRPGPGCSAVHLVAGDPFGHDVGGQGGAGRRPDRRAVRGRARRRPGRGRRHLRRRAAAGVRTTADVDDIAAVDFDGARRRPQPRLGRARRRRR